MLELIKPNALGGNGWFALYTNKPPYKLNNFPNLKNNARLVEAIAVLDKIINNFF